MNLVASVRAKLLLHPSEDLTQAQYEAVTSPITKDRDILAIHDEIFGSNLRRIPQKSLDEGPFVSHDAGVDGADSPDDANDGGNEEVTTPDEPVRENVLTA
jgi:hypothetical protein